MKYPLVVIAIGFCFITGCGVILGDILFPNYCQECKVIDPWGSSVWSEEECGGGQEAMENRCKAFAYDKNYWGGSYRCECSIK